MRRSTFTKAAGIAAMLAVLIMIWVVNSSGQGVKPVPGAGTGIVTVEGMVNVANTPTVLVANSPTVNAVQNGNWRVAVENLPAVTLTNPDFLQAKRSYTVTWPDMSTRTIVVAEVGSNGWVRVETQERRRWVNMSQVLAIEEASASAR